jgi:hypothetical protein
MPHCSTHGGRFSNPGMTVLLHNRRPTDRPPVRIWPTLSALVKRAFVSDNSIVGATFLLVVLAIVITWPQARYLGTKISAWDDPLFSIWRLAWLAHILPTDPTHLFDGNIFHPHARTLAFSDATLLEGIVAAPWLWADANPVLVYNLLLYGGMVASGLGMFVLVRYLTHNPDAALVSAAIFTVAPYRVEHFMHLELQWTMWMPLTLWAIHRVFDEGSIRRGVIAGTLLALQLLSCVYYGAFLGMIVAAFVILLAVARPARARAAILPLCIGALLPAILALAYGRPYLANARVTGTRDPQEIMNFSAQLVSYVTAPVENWLWGWTGGRFDGNERHLFPGVVAVGLAVAAFAHRRGRRHVWIYLAVTMIAVEFSLGMNGTVYRWLHDRIWALEGFRAPARFGILVMTGLAVLAGFGFEAVQRIVPARRGLLAAALIAVTLECGSGPMPLDQVPSATPDVYKFLSAAEPGVVIELPLTDGVFNPTYMYWSTKHWQRLVNGYSGITPRDYDETVARMRTFPDDAAIARLRHIGVRYILIHEYLFSEKERLPLILGLARRPELHSGGKYRDWVGTTQVFELRAGF